MMNPPSPGTICSPIIIRTTLVLSSYSLLEELGGLLLVVSGLFRLAVAILLQTSFGAFHATAVYTSISLGGSFVVVNGGNRMTFCKETRAFKTTYWWLVENSGITSLHPYSICGNSEMGADPSKDHPPIHRNL